MTIEEMTVSDALLVEFRRLLQEEYLVQVTDARVREGLLLVQHGVAVNHAHISYFASHSVWRTHRLLEASLQYGGETSTMTRLYQEWLYHDRPQLQQRVAASAPVATDRTIVHRPMVQLVTYGTAMNDGLDALLMSSIVSGVPLEVMCPSIVELHSSRTSSH